ncbi:uncharacterized protein LOC134847758 isoform X3 [Symsagittifera roscoffensis]|uniref:uncharacterized protein LOC134847758 isoform X3 n=1 Tax=Symsagittifera roscoffensis TaxID=84072 RepID=UPI00307C2FD8
MSTEFGLYQSTSTNRARLLENEFQKEFNNFKSDLEDFEMSLGVAPRASSTAQIPLSCDHFRKMRQLTIDRALQVPGAKPLKIQSEIMKEVMNDSLKLEYTNHGVAFILLDFFVNSVRETAVCRYKHLLRWKRFIHSSKDAEKLYPEYRQRLGNNLAQYNDFISRAKRLSVARDGHLFNKMEMGFNAIQEDDFQIFTKWIITHFHATKRFNQFYKGLQWVHLIRRSDLTFEAIDSELQSMETMKEGTDYGDNGSLLHQKSANAGHSSKNDDARTSVSASSAYTSESQHYSTMYTSSGATLTAAAADGQPAAIYGSQQGFVLAGDYVCEPNSSCSDLGVPYLTSSFEDLSKLLEAWIKCYGIKADIEMIESAADEMDLFSKVNKIFSRVFQKQESQFSFPVYETMDSGKIPWGKDTSDHCVLKEATWLDHCSMNPRIEHAGQVKFFTQLRAQSSVDELLKAQSAFLSIKQYDQVQRVLKYQATSLRINRVIEPSSVASHRCENRTHKLFLEIYTNESLFTSSGDRQVDSDLDDMEEDGTGGTKTRRKSKKKNLGVNSYDYSETLQLLGLNEGDADSDTVNLQGGHLAYIHLRHLRIRELKRNCLASLNYFRSLERTLTVNDNGVSLDGSLDQIPQDKHDLPEYHLASGPNPLESHAYLYNTPADYQIYASKFMDLSDVENHDDYYFVGNKYEKPINESSMGSEESELVGTSGSTRVHVQDEKGFYIMYDVAVSDFHMLEKDLLLMGSYFIQKERESFKRSEQMFKKSKQGSFLDSESKMAEESHKLSKYGHEMVDRMGVLFDLWNCEFQFLEKKQQLIDLYMECYHHTLNIEDQRRLAQIVTDLIHLRPRIDPNDSYFVKIYRLETINLSLKIDLVRKLIESHVETQRDYVSRICREGDEFYGIPMNIIPKQPVLLHNNLGNLQPLYLLEFHPTLAHIAGLETFLRHGFQGAVDHVGPMTVTETLALNKIFLEKANAEWDALPPYGGGYSVQVQKELYADMFIEDPLFVCEVGHSLAVDEDGSRKPMVEKQNQMVLYWSRLLEILTLRHRLMESAWEGEVLSKLYRTVCVSEKIDEFHLYMRLNQFEYGQQKNRNPPPFLSHISEDDGALIDRYIPSFLSLAVHELDDNQVGSFNFRSREGLLKLMSSPTGVENLQVALLAQICNDNVLQVCSELNLNAAQIFQKPYVNEKERLMAANSKKGTGHSKRGLLAPTKPFGVADKHESEKAADSVKLKHSKSAAKTPAPPAHTPEAFISVQLEKSYVRDLMMNEFVKKKSQNALMMRNQEEVEKMKRKLICWFCTNLTKKTSEYTAKSQMLLCYGSMLKLLDSYPFLRDNYFSVGQFKEKKAAEDDRPLDNIAQQGNFVKRPRRVLSSNGKQVLNIWFIPHPSELMHLFRNLDEDSKNKACLQMCTIVSAVHDIFKLLSAHAMAGCSYARLGSQVNTVSAAWGGIEGIGTELVEIQKQINALANPNDPEQVTGFLKLKRETMLLEFETAVRYPIRDQFIVAKNTRAYQDISIMMHFALNSMINVQIPNVCGGNNLITPLPHQGRDPLAKELFPWRASLDRNGSFLCCIDSPNTLIDSVLLCFSPLRNAERQVANGEILGMSLMLEDVLQTGEHAFSLSDDPKAPKSPLVTDVDGSLLEESTPHLHLKNSRKSLSKLKEPVESYRVCQQFLLLWKRNEFLRLNWALGRLGNIKRLTRVAEFKEFVNLYRRDVFYPTVRTLAKKYNQLDHYLNATINDTDPITIPRGCSEVELRLKLTVKLMDTIECRMIDSMRKKMAMEHAKLLAEKSREEGALPTDLWKKPAIKEQFTLIRPHIAEQFSEKLASIAEQTTDTTVTLRREDLTRSLAWLGDSLMEREKRNFETYSMFYENILKHKTRLLFKTEQDKKQLIESMKDFHRNSAVDSQCRLAAECYSLLMEVTALRCQLEEKDSEIVATEKKTREAVRSEFMELVHDLFQTTYTNRVDVSQYQLHFFNDASDLIQKAGDEVRRKIDDWKDKVAEAATWDRFDREIDEFNKQTLVEYRNNILDLRQQKEAMEVSMEKQKAYYKWKISSTKQQLLNELEDCKGEVDGKRRERLGMQLMCEEEVGLYRQQCTALKRSLAQSENSQQKLHSMLMKEQKEKMEKDHEKQQRARSDQQLEVTRAANFENLLSKLEESEMRFRSSLIEKSRMDKANEYLFDKSQKTIDSLKKNLNAERAVKQDAVSRLDDLQSMVGEGNEDSYVGGGASKSRPQTANSSVISTYGTNAGLSQRVKSAGTSGRNRPFSSGYSSVVRPLTSEGNYGMGTQEGSRVTSGRVTGAGMSRPVSSAFGTPGGNMNRPKTSSARLQQGNTAAATRIYRQLKQEEQYWDHRAMVEVNHTNKHAAAAAITANTPTDQRQFANSIASRPTSGVMFQQ